MDSWTEKQINLMKNGGNNKFNDFLKAYDIKKETPIANKYNQPAAILYKDRYYKGYFVKLMIIALSF